LTSVTSSRRRLGSNRNRAAFVLLAVSAAALASCLATPPSSRPAPGSEPASPAAAIPLGIAVFELDASDNPISTAETAAGLLAELGRAGFKVTALPVSAASVAGRKDAQVLAALAAFQSQVERVVFGTARISESVLEGSTLILQVTGTVKVLELSTGRILLTVNRSKRAQGGNVSAALAAAFKMLGEDLGKEIASQLR